MPNTVDFVITKFCALYFSALPLLAIHITFALALIFTM